MCDEEAAKAKVRITTELVIATSNRCAGSGSCTLDPKKEETY
jgi:hypothetical protein